MQYFFNKLRDIDLNTMRFSIMCVEEPDEYTKCMMFRLISDIGQIVEEFYNAVILQEEYDGKIMEEAIPNPEFFKEAYPNLKPYMVMYMTIKFEDFNTKSLFIDEFLKLIT